MLRRCEYRRGSFFDGALPCGDVLVLKHVLHDWSDDCAVTILRGCRAAVPAHARLLIVEALLDRVQGPSPVDWMDLGIMTAFGGRERTLEEYRGLCAAAGFRLARRIDTQGIVSIVEAEPI